ncbi:Syh1p NDAI_0E02600 [Naumovozyma dairenensis CBS 421]|uniref:GYF domain-containing protein n=1 Tax=Naumovozyma dairenensis (strain ATCC 10597 / BCRC 20456 / CBS 421 / NBRC 0211 / NRRL Y-12639) TaxID=1071378 RepID=G0WBF7_NAUDC|nr:hypothetical protein NDAI_0E02600 [Naumovozyma dairenensis CBS 421]CCD25077.1 hypothetical protein NDAI_0E02600 [Naumovozyma dairenensis CBS 421]
MIDSVYTAAKMNQELPTATPTTHSQYFPIDPMVNGLSDLHIVASHTEAANGQTQGTDPLEKLVNMNIGVTATNSGTSSLTASTQSASANSLNKKSRLLDSMNIQRSGSPFLGKENMQSPSLDNNNSNNAGNSTWPSANYMGSHSTTSLSALQSQSKSELALQMSHLTQNRPFSFVQQHPNITSSLPVNLVVDTSQPHAGYFGPPAPPGIGNPALNAIRPIHVISQWRYIDIHGQQQGPFPSTSMSQWLQAGYFQPSLQIQRVNTSMEPFGINEKYITLNDLIAKVNNFQDPFDTFDKIASHYAIGKNIATTNNSDLPSSEAHDADEQIKQKAKELANIRSDDYTLDEILNLKFDDGSYYREVVVQIPMNTRKIVTKLDDSFEVPTLAAAPISVQYPDMTAQDEPQSQPQVEQHIESLQETVPAIEEEQVVTKEEKAPVQQDYVEGATEEVENIPEEVSTSKKKKKKKKTDNAEEIEKKRKEKAELMAKKLLEEQEEEARKERSKKVKKQEKEEKKKLKHLRKEEKERQRKMKKEDAELEELKSDSVSADNVAPWADSNSANNVTSTKKGLSIGEYLKQEELKKAQEKKERERQNRENLLKLNQQLVEEEQKANEMKSVLSWADKPTQEPIQVNITPSVSKKLETKTKLKIKSSSKKSKSTFIEEQQKIWEQLQGNSQSTAATESVNSNAWTTVSSSTKSTTSVPAATPMPAITKAMKKKSKASTTKQIGSSTSIPGLKLKSNSPGVSPSYPGNASISARQTFLKWCRSQMHLNPGISVNSVLEVLLSLPAGLETKEIIADTIYSNSSIMDGRRFATDFIKKRIDCEKQLMDPLTWKEALALPEGSKDDWEFQIVSKKKGRKH